MNTHIDEGAKVVNDEINAATGKSLTESVLKTAFSKIVLSTEVSEQAMKEFGDISVEQGFIAETYKDLFTDKSTL